MREDRTPEEKLIRILRTLAPGTPLREGLENVLRARTGGLIVVGDSPQVMELVDGGFKLDMDFLPASLYELAKMDGAIILSRDARRILYANAQLVPDPAIPSFETGIRHRTAERVARQTGELVIAISQRRHIISLYKGPTKYVLREINVILTKANQALQTLEKYKSVLDQTFLNLTALELEDLVTVLDVVNVLRRYEMVRRIQSEIEWYIAELGTEGRLVSMQLEELVSDLADEVNLVIRDYLAPGDDRTPETVREALASHDPEALMDPLNISRALGLALTVSRALGLEAVPATLDASVAPRGYRVLRRKIARLPMHVVENLVAHFTTLRRVLEASIEELDDVDGIGETRARTIKEGLRRLREQVLLDRRA